MLFKLVALLTLTAEDVCFFAISTYDLFGNAIFETIEVKGRLACPCQDFFDIPTSLRCSLSQS